MDQIPLWALYVIAALVTAASIEAGWRIGIYRFHHVHKDEKSSIGTVVAATMGLLAFLLAFTFGMAADRYETRRQIVLDETNAIYAAYLRADFLSDTERDRVRAALRDYVTLHAGGMSAVASPEGIVKSAGAARS